MITTRNRTFSPFLTTQPIAYDRSTNEKLLAEIINSAMDAIIVIDEQQRIILFNTTAATIFRCQVEDALGQSLKPFLPALVSSELQWLAEPRRSSNGEAAEVGQSTAMMARRIDGELFPIEASIAPMIVDTRSFFTVILRDITARYQTEEAMLRNERRLQMALATAQMGIWEWNAAERAIYWSPECYSILGFPQDIGKLEQFLQLVHPDDLDQIRESIAQSVKTREDLAAEYRWIRPNGEIRWVLTRGHFIFDEEGQFQRIVGAIQDITERVQLEEQLRQAQKMEAIGQLAGGVAHDFNNLLTVINGYSNLLLAKLPHDDRNRGYIQNINDAGLRAEALTRQLLTFSRKQIAEPKLVEINNILRGIESMLHRLIGEDIALVTLYRAEDGYVRVDPHQIEQVIMNLVVNARDAMQNGGQLTIETRNIFLDERYCRRHANVRPGRYLRLAITDTGKGIAPEVQQHIFEPFFTTKEAGKGTGLGLATVFGIVKQSDGHIQVYSEVGFGTCFKIYLPIVQEEAPTATAQNTQQATIGSETILLVEDDEAVRAITKLALEEYGYQVITAQNGIVAVEFARHHMQPIHLLITDVIMPKMHGSQVAEQLRQHYPTLKTIYMSGYTDDAIINHSLLDKDCAFINKPFSPNALAQKVREVLDDTVE